MAAYPYLAVASVDDALDFYRRAFGGACLKRSETRDGRIVYAEVGFERDERVLIGAAGNSSLAPALVQGQGAVYLYTPDLDGLVSRALFAGAELIRAARMEDWGERVAVLRDLDGNRWFWAEPLRDASGDATGG
ncbi:MAG TPA: VOC family protein [Candidatus Hydrogenedentes bacterium]|nr:VOC family protein [Candidatus Hydrogenedentota bacterium]HOK88644.1 VOC family protein [Candidatus Hydrogenedentota bacterium]